MSSWRLCEDGKWRDKEGNIACKHKRVRRLCRECRGSSICKHGRNRSECKDCGGVCVCEHGRKRSACGLCGGASVFKAHKSGAAHRGYTSDLTESRYRWLISKPCSYCGSPSGGVDRVKNEYGYTTLNSVPCCGACNKAKLAMSAPDFIARILRAAAHNPSYTVFKTRWTETRTSGPDLEVTT
jgi:hypothetical protein